jgi:DNA-binding response OmpR family regulator
MEIDGAISFGSATSVLPQVQNKLERRERILVVDDDAEMRELLEDGLQEEGYLTSGAGDTLSAIIHLLARPVDVLVLDWKMPDLDGFVLLKSVRRLFPDLPVIFISAHNQPEVHRRAIESGAFGFLAKPFPLRLLLAEVQGATAEIRRATTDETTSSRDRT